MLDFSLVKRDLVIIGEIAPLETGRKACGNRGMMRFGVVVVKRRASEFPALSVTALLALGFRAFGVCLTPWFGVAVTCCLSFCYGCSVEFVGIFACLGVWVVVECELAADGGTAVVTP